MYSDGSTHVSTEIDVDSLSPDFEIDLFGPSVDNFVAVGEDGFLLSSEIIENKATIDTFGSSSITVEYDIHDLISKEGRVWTFSFDSSSDYTLLMPTSSIIVGMSTIPKNMEIMEEQTKLELSSGATEINYILGTPQNPIDTPPTTTSPTEDYHLTNHFWWINCSWSCRSIYNHKEKQIKIITSTIQTEIISEKPAEEKFVDPQDHL